jgi:hypothetical protein
MEAVGSSEILAGFYQTTQQHIPEDGTLNVKRLQKMGKKSMADFETVLEGLRESVSLDSQSLLLHFTCKKELPLHFKDDKLAWDPLDLAMKHHEMVQSRMYEKDFHTKVIRCKATWKFCKFPCRMQS